jgi:VanZ family protein
MLNPARFQGTLRNWLIVLIGYWLALFVATHLPRNAPRLPGNPPDKLLHFAAYAGLGALVATVLHLAIGRLTLRHLGMAWLAIAAYGALDEWTQVSVGRDASIGDWLADVIGAAIGVGLFSVWDHVRGPVAGVPMAPHPPNNPGRSWRGYSLKALFAVATLAAVICYWLVLPTVNAQRFAAAMHHRDYAVAESLFVSPAKVFPGSFKQHRHFEPRVGIEPMTWNDFWKGERRIGVGISYGDGDGIASCAAEIRARRAGLELVMVVP